MGSRRRPRLGSLRLGAEFLERRAMLSASADAFSSSVTRLIWQGREVEAMRDEWLVRMPQLNAATARNVADYQSAMPAIPQGWRLRDVGLGMLGVTAPGASVATVAQWAAAQGTLWVQPNFVYTRQASIPNEGAVRPPSNPGFGSLWGLHNTGQSGVLDTDRAGTATGPGTVDADIDAPEAWTITTGSRRIIIAVLDDGIDHTHPDLQPNMWSRPANVPSSTYGLHGWDSADGDGEIRSADPNDTHGTHVAGTIGARGNNSLGVAGVAWDVQLYGAKVFSDSGGATVANLVDAIQRIVRLKTDYGQNIVAINASLGSYAANQGLSDAIAAANTAGILFVASAGNGRDPNRQDGVGDNNDVLPTYPASYPLANVISVAASNRQDRLTRFSNYGIDSVDIAAPGSGVWSTVYGAQYDEYPGTSMAAPHVTGVAALVASAYLTNVGRLPTVDEMKTAILDGADRPATLTYTESTANGDPFPGTVHRIAENRRLNAFGAIRRALGYPDVTIGDTVVVEGDAGSSFATVTVSLSAASTQTVTMDFATVDGSASTADNDYVAASGTLTFAPGETEKTIQIEVVGDVRPEADETLTVQLTNLVGAFPVDVTGTVTIQTDDVPPAVTIADVEVEEGDSGSSFALVTVSLAAAYKQPVSMNYATFDGSARAGGGDFVATSGALTFAPGETQKTVQVEIVGDTTIEPDETFSVRLSNLVNGTATDLTGVVTIRNDDVPASVFVNDIEVTEGTGGGTIATFTIELTVPRSHGVSVRYVTLERTATPRDNDYRSVSGTAFIPAGQTSVTVPVQITTDSKYEADEKFAFRIMSATGVPISRSIAHCTIVNDDAMPVPIASVSDVRLTEGQSTRKLFAFIVTLSTRSPVEVSVGYQTVDGTAISGSDYIATSGTLRFMPGVTRLSVSVWVNGDTTFEATEQFALELVSPSGVTLGRGTGLGTILNDDRAAAARRVTASMFAALAAEESLAKPTARRR